MSISILIADADALLRDLLADLLGRHEGFHVVGCVATGRDALEAVARLQPDVLLLDLHLPDPTGLRVLEALTQVLAPPVLLVLSRDDTDDTQMDVARRGAQGFLCKSQGVSALTNAIRAVMSGEVWFTRQIVGRILREYATLLRRVQEQERPANHLSPREREILGRVARGMTNQQIADDLRMSLGTVKVHIRNIFQKFDLPNRTEAAVFALREGLLEQGVAADSPN